MVESPSRPPDEALREMLRSMLRIRSFEEMLARLHKRGQLPGFVHLYIGEEAVAVGVCSALRRDDRITSTHRGHGHLLAKGAGVDGMMAELFGKQTGLCQGKGGSMHSVDFALGVLGTNGIVGGGIPIATGSAWADKHFGRDNVTVSFFGDGASNQGVFHEAMNLSSLWKLPVIFCCENNGYTEWTATEKLTSGSIVERAKPFGIPGVRVDGNDVLAVHAAVAEAVARGRAGEGPTLLECVTYRHHGHNEGEEAFSGDYRPEDEISVWKGKDPIPGFRARLIEWGVMSDEQVDALADQERAGVKAAVDRAKADPFPDPDDALLHSFAGVSVASGRAA